MSAPEDHPAPETPPSGNNGWTLVLISVGVSLLACCFVLPQTEQNRQLSFEVRRLESRLDYAERQVAANGEFIKRIDTDPVVAERLAQRQMKFIRKGASVLNVDDGPSRPDPSPFS